MGVKMGPSPFVLNSPSEVVVASRVYMRLKWHQRHFRNLLAFAIAVLTSAIANAATPSFDCAQASEPVEKLICDNAAIGDLDGRLGAAFRRAQARDPQNADTRSAEEQQWLNERDAACQIDKADAVDCLARFYRIRIGELEGDGSFACRRAIRLYEKSTSEVEYNTNRPLALAACAAEASKFPRVRTMARSLLANCDKLDEGAGGADTGPHLVESCMIDAYRYLIDFEER